MISKKLLSEVLGLDIEDIISEDRFVYYTYMYYGCILEKDINTYELAHKCKELAKEKNLIVSSNLDSVLVTDNGSLRELFKSDTEPEAIFKACEWILEQERK